MQYALLAIVGLLVLLIGYWVMKRRPPTPPRRHPAPMEPHHPTPQAQLAKLKESPIFWGYRIESHCGASSRLAGQQFTMDELPPLPVQGCSHDTCDCRLAGLANQRKQIDRRSGQDRRGSLRMDSEDRRSDRPRRTADLNNWGTYNPL